MATLDTASDIAQSIQEIRGICTDIASNSKLFLNDHKASSLVHLLASSTGWVTKLGDDVADLADWYKTHSRVSPLSPSLLQNATVQVAKTAANVEMLKARLQNEDARVLQDLGQRFLNPLQALDSLRQALAAAQGALRLQGSAPTTPTQQDPQLPQPPKPPSPPPLVHPPVRTNLFGRLLCLRDLLVGAPVSLVRNVVGNIALAFWSIKTGLADVRRDVRGWDNRLFAMSKIVFWSAAYAVWGIGRAVAAMLYDMVKAFEGIFVPSKWLVHVADHPNRVVVGFRKKFANGYRVVLGVFIPRWGHVSWMERRGPKGHGVKVEIEVTNGFEKDARWLQTHWQHFYDFSVDKIIASYRRDIPTDNIRRP